MPAGQFAFVTFFEGRESERSLAMFKEPEKKFTYPPAALISQLVLGVEGEIVIEPDFELGTVEVRSVSKSDTSALFIRGSEVYAVLDVGKDFGLHVFSLSSGVIKVGGKIGHMAACSAWRLGIKAPGSAETRWLINV